MRLRKREVALAWETWQGDQRQPGLGVDERGSLGGLEEGGFADLALDVASLLVLLRIVSVDWELVQRESRHVNLTHHLELRLGNLALLLGAFTLLLSFGTLCFVSAGQKTSGGFHSR